MSLISDVHLYTAIVQQDILLRTQTQKLDFEARARKHAEDAGKQLRQSLNATMVELTTNHLKRYHVPVPRNGMLTDASRTLKQVVAQLYDEGQQSVVLICRKVQKLGYCAPDILEQHFARVLRKLGRPGEVRAIVVFSRTKGVLDTQHGVIRPANMGFIKFESEAAAHLVFEYVRSNGGKEFVSCLSGDPAPVELEKFRYAQKIEKPLSMERDKAAPAAPIFPLKGTIPSAALGLPPATAACEAFPADLATLLPLVEALSANALPPPPPAPPQEDISLPALLTSLSPDIRSQVIEILLSAPAESSEEETKDAPQSLSNRSTSDKSIRHSQSVASPGGGLED